MAWISKKEIEEKDNLLDRLSKQYADLNREKMLLINELKLTKAKLKFMEETDKLHKLYENEIDIVIKALENMRLVTRRD